MPRSIRTLTRAGTAPGRAPLLRLGVFCSCIVTVTFGLVALDASATEHPATTHLVVLRAPTPPPATTTPPTTTSTAPPAPPTAPAPAATAAEGAVPLPAYGRATAFGCGPALAYLRAYAAPGFALVCPGWAGGTPALTCYGQAPCVPGQKMIVIAKPCPVAYMNEAHNSWVLANEVNGTPIPDGNPGIDPYGAC